jgi:prepilin-type N-terminal cleavage/methylation domain-containing protein
MSRTKAFTLVELLVVIAIIAVLLSVLIPSLRVAKNMGQRIQCSSHLKGLAASLAPYAEMHDGKMPAMDVSLNGSSWTMGNAVHAPYYISAYIDTASPRQIWMLLGCLFNAGIIDNGKTFYCPATEGWLDEYKGYTTAGPWGTNLPNQQANQTTSSIGIRMPKGYTYWPQGRKPVYQVGTNLYGPYDSRALGDGRGWGRYNVGFPAPPLKYSDLGPNYAFAVDHQPHAVRGSGYVVGAAWGDGHAGAQKVPQYNHNGTLKWICYFQGTRPSDYKTTEWYGDGSIPWDNITVISNYIYMLQP